MSRGSYARHSVTRVTPAGPAREDNAQACHSRSTVDRLTTSQTRSRAAALSTAGEN